MNVIIYDVSSSNHNKNKPLNHSLFILQKRIYDASKECNLNLVHSLQKLLISSYSIKEFATKLVKQKIIPLYCIDLSQDISDNVQIKKKLN